MKKLDEAFQYFIIGCLCEFKDFILTIVLFSLGSSLFFTNSFGYITGSIFSYVGYSNKRKSNRT